MNKKKTILILLLVIFLIPVFIFGQNNLENDYPQIPGAESPSTNAESFFSYIYSFIVIVGVTLSVLVIIWQGINMVIAQGEPGPILIAKERIKLVLFGLFILMASYIILRTINPKLVEIEVPNIPEFIEDQINPNKNTPTFPKEEFQEVPIGTIVESLLAGNSSKNIEGYKDETEELCFAYDENGNTIDRNKDGYINEKDTLKGVDMFYCLTELNKALIKKIKDINGGNYTCKNASGGVIEKMKAHIVAGCDCKNCYVYPRRIDPYQCSVCTAGCCRSPRTPFGCGSNCSSCSQCCDERCQCCGRMYYQPDTGCQDDYVTGGGDVDHDPCQKMRDSIDCDRAEIRIRIDGTYDWAPGCCGTACPFITYFKTNYDQGPGGLPNGYQFLIITTALERVKSFESYFKNHLDDLKKAESMMRNPYAERMSLAEFQAIQVASTKSATVEPKAFDNTNKNYSYDVVKYCREFNCTGYKNNNVANLCTSGTRETLTDKLYKQEELYDPVYNNPEIKDRRVCSVETDTEIVTGQEKIEKYYYDGDPATFYYKEGFSNQTIAPITKCALETNTEKELIKSVIPIGEVVDDTEKFTGDILTLITQIKEETQKVITKGTELSELPEKCDCTLGCGNGSDCKTSCDENGCCSASCSTCTNCKGNNQKVCSCCDECQTFEIPDPNYVFEGSVESDLIHNGAGMSGVYVNVYNLDGGDRYWSYLACPDQTLPYKRSVFNAYTGKYNNPIDTTIGSFSKYLPSYIVSNCQTEKLDRVASIEKDAIKYDFSYRTTFTLTPKVPTTSINTCQQQVDKDLLNKMNWWCIGAESSSDFKGIDYQLSWTSNNTFETVVNLGSYSYSCGNIVDSKGKVLCRNDQMSFALPFVLPTGYTATCEEKEIEGQYMTWWNFNNTAYETTQTNFDHTKKLVVTLINTQPVEKGQSNSAPWYVCPWNDILDRQCRIYKHSDTVDAAYPENINTDYDCRTEDSPGTGYLQKIELLNERIKNLVSGKNLRQGDINRWRTLEMLTISRERMEACVLGYGKAYKINLSEAILFSCQEGIDAGILNKYVVVPEFPYPKSSSSWNCYPLNSNNLTVDQKKTCYANKDLEWNGSSQGCQIIIKEYMDNYYCCQGRNY
jgi:hypothetical protein